MVEEVNAHVPLPVQKHFEDVSSVWGKRYDNEPRSMSDLDLLLRRENAQRLLRAIIAASESRRLDVLDIGCGTGNALDGISRDSIRVTGIDAVAEMVQVAAREHPEDRFLTAAIEDLPIEDNSADVVLCLGVLEYVEDVGRALDSLARVLRPGGYLIVSFPNKQSLFRKLTRFTVGIEELGAGCKRRLQGRQNRDDSRTAYRHTQWSLRQCRDLLQTSGFEVREERFNTFGIWGRIGRWHLSKCFSTWASRAFDRSRWIGSWFAFTIVICAQKPSSVE